MEPELFAGKQLQRAIEKAIADLACRHPVTAKPRFEIGAAVSEALGPIRQADLKKYAKERRVRLTFLGT